MDNTNRKRGMREGMEQHNQLEKIEQKKAVKTIETYDIKFVILNSLTMKQSSVTFDKY